MPFSSVWYSKRFAIIFQNNVKSYLQTKWVSLIVIDEDSGRGLVEKTGK